jgi:hypothetical protein
MAPDDFKNLGLAFEGDKEGSKGKDGSDGGSNRAA